jgi:hypothetical protein
MSLRPIVLASLLALSLVAVPASADVDGKAGKKTPAQSAKKKTVKAGKPAAVFRAPAPKSMRAALHRMARTRVNVHFKQMEFAEVVEFIGVVAGFNVIVAPELQKEGAQVAPITLKLRDVTVKRLAELVARFSKTTLHFRNGIIEFTTAKAARGKPVLHIYSVAELTTPLRNFPGPDLNLRPSGAEFEPEEESVTDSPFGQSDNLAEMIQNFVVPDSWEDDGVSIQAYTGKLIVRTYPKVHRKIALFLAKLRRAR